MKAKKTLDTRETQQLISLNEYEVPITYSLIKNLHLCAVGFLYICHYEQLPNPPPNQQSGLVQAYHTLLDICLRC